AFDVFGAKLSRRGFLQTGGALYVGVALVGSDAWTNALTAAETDGGLDPKLGTSWIEIHADNSITFRTGKSDFGQGSVSVAYRQIVAEELRLPYEGITKVISGDTDRTPDGGNSTDFMGRGMVNVKKAAAYTYQALLDVAATQLGVPKDQLTAANGVI